MSPLHAALRAGFGAASALTPGGRLWILIFHRVQEAVDPLFPGEPDRARFSTLCGWLARWCRVLPLDEAVRGLARGTLPPRAACITFDDGYADNHDVAMPVLRSHGLSATFFIATNYLDGGRMWNDTIVESVRRTRRGELGLAGLGLDSLPPALSLDGIVQRRASMHRLLETCKYLPDRRRAEVVQAIAERCAVELPADLMMTTGQLRSMRDHGMLIGAHTLSHPILAGLDDARSMHEIGQSREVLEGLLGQPVTLFAYPNGRPDRDYRRRDADHVRRAGFEAAVTTAPGGATPGGADPYQLPRFTPWDADPARFGLRLLRAGLGKPGTATE